MTRQRLIELVAIPLMVGLIILAIQLIIENWEKLFQNLSTPVESETPATVAQPDLQSSSVFQLRRNDVMCTKNEARIWLRPDVFHLDGSKDEALFALPVGEKVYVVKGPHQGRIKHDALEEGWWWQVASTKDGTPKGWIWEKRITDCSYFTN